MMSSFTYYITLQAIKWKGIKSIFRKDPIDYYKLRKEDILIPKAKYLQPLSMNRFRISNTMVTQLKPEISNGHLILFCHGGAFVYGPVKHHWDAAKKLVAKTGCYLWMVDYPKAPENKIDHISKNIDKVYRKALQYYNPEKIILIGDSAGATLLTALVQRLVQQKQNLPSMLVLISPVMDARLNNPEIHKIDTKDPVLSRAGVLSAKKMCAVDEDLEDQRISPILGSFKNFPLTLLLLAENDITYPDQLLAVKKLENENVETKVILGKKMPHIWPLLPVMSEGKAAFSEIITEIKRHIAGGK